MDHSTYPGVAMTMTTAATTATATSANASMHAPRLRDPYASAFSATMATTTTRTAAAPSSRPPPRPTTRTNSHATQHSPHESCASSNSAPSVSASASASASPKFSSPNKSSLSSLSVRPSFRRTGGRAVFPRTENTPPRHFLDDRGVSLSGHLQRVTGHSLRRSHRATYHTKEAILRGGDGFGVDTADANLPGGDGHLLLPGVHHHPLHVPRSATAADGPIKNWSAGATSAGVDAADDGCKSHKKRPRPAAASAAAATATATAGNGLNSPHPDLAALLSLARRARDIVDALLLSDESAACKDGADNRRRTRALIARAVVYALPILLVLGKCVSPLLDRATRPPQWRWKPERRLDGRRCAMNLFVEKQPHDEFDPDHQLIKPGELNKDGTPKVPSPPKVVDGTYRTKGQMHILERFIEAVADSFRSNTKLRQHIIFTGVRDGGHVAEVALQHWPPRGTHRAQIHVVADDLTDDATEKALEYGSLDAIERRFKGDVNVHVYSRDGKAGLEGDDDDAESLDLGDDDGLNYKPSYPFSGEGGVSALPYPDLTEMIRNVDEDDDEDGEVAIPYLHIDGLSHSRQQEILEAARPILEDKTVRAVGMERSADLDIPAIIEFFRSVGYKTFFLGSRQIYRVDHLCSEILEEVLAYPGINRHSLHGDMSNPFRVLLRQWGILHDPLAHYRDLPKGSTVTFAPFVVALPMGRRTTDGTHNGRQEMTIQHMYDLFGGYGGGGQIKTANDRKAPGKK